MNEYVTLAELAAELGLDRSNMRKYVLKCGLNPVRVRTPESRQQLTLALIQADAETVREMRQSQGFSESGRLIENNGLGYFYVVQLVPDLAPNRVKLGFASDVRARLDAHRTAAPTATLVKSWPCKNSWEQAAIASVTRTECSLIRNEVFECEDLACLVERAVAFFALMPTGSL